MDGGDAELLSLIAFGVEAGVCAREFLREFFFEARVAAEPTGIVWPLPRLRFLITSVFSDRGRTTPCNFKNKPQALHKGCPSGFLRHNGVVWVKQFVQVVGAPFWSMFFRPGLPGLEGTWLLKPDSGGELAFEECI